MILKWFQPKFEPLIFEIVSKKKSFYYVNLKDFCGIKEEIIKSITVYGNFVLVFSRAMDLLYPPSPGPISR